MQLRKFHRQVHEEAYLQALALYPRYRSIAPTVQERGGNRRTMSKAAWLLGHFPANCTYCGSGDRYLTVDHIWPLSKGGTNARDNKTLACAKCNAEKSDILPEEWERYRQLLVG